MEDGGPAAAADLQMGDIVSRFDDHAFRDTRELSRVIAKATAEQTAPVAVPPGGRECIFQVMIKLRGYPFFSPTAACCDLGHHLILGAVPNVAMLAKMGAQQ